MRSHEIKTRIRYGETDQMGVVYHANYVQFIEMGRTEWLRALGISYKEMEEAGVMLPVISIQINYKKSAYYDDVLTVRTTLKKLPSVKIEFEYEILNESKEIITKGNTILAFINMKIVIIQMEMTIGIFMETFLKTVICSMMILKTMILLTRFFTIQ